MTMGNIEHSVGISIPDAAITLRCSPSKLQIAVSEGRMPSITGADGAVLIPRAAVLELQASGSFKLWLMDLLD